MAGKCAAKILLSPQSPQASQKKIDLKQDYRCKATVLAATTGFRGTSRLVSILLVELEEELKV